MYIKNKAAAMIWRIALLALSLFGLLDGAGIVKGHYSSNFPHMFTNVSNMFNWLYCACALIYMIKRSGDQEDRVFAPLFK